MSHKDISKWESMNIISNYMIINYLNCLLKAVTSLRVSSNWQRQAAANFDVSPKLVLSVQNKIRLFVEESQCYRR